jgi:predicted Zn-dependent protease with MMP-like domain
MVAEETRNINIDIRTVDPDKIVDFRDVIINTKLPGLERLKDIIRQTGEIPHIMKLGKVLILNSYADTEATIEDRVEEYFGSL